MKCRFNEKWLVNVMRDECLQDFKILDNFSH